MAENQEDESLTEGWPEPVDPELTHFGQQLRDNRPMLSAEAMLRIHVAMQEEIAPRPSTPARWRIVQITGIAAAIGLGVMLFIRQRHHQGSRPVEAIAHLEHEHYTVNYSGPVIDAGTKPLVPLKDYAGLLDAK